VTKRVVLGGAAIAASMVVGLLAACGGGTTPSSTPASAGAGGRAAFQAYTDCLRQHGVTIAIPSGRARPSDRPSGVRPSGRGFGGGGGFGGGFGPSAPPGVDQGTWDAAQQACASVRPSFGQRGGGSAFQAYRSCLRDHGVTASNGPEDSADPAVAAAMATCAPLRPTPRASAS